MRKIIFQEGWGSNLKIVVLSAVFGLLAVFLSGYLFLNLSPAVYIFLIGSIVVVTITALLLKKIDMAVPMLIMFIPVDRLVTIMVKLPDDSKLKWVFFNAIDIEAILAVICLLVYKSTIKGVTSNIKARTGSEYKGILFFILVTYGLLSVLWTPDSGIGIFSGIKLFVNFCIYMLLFHLIKTEEKILRTIRTLLFTTVVTAVIMLVSALPIDFLNIKKIYPLTNELYSRFAFETYQLRASGTIETHNAGIFLGFGALFGMGLLSHSKEKKEKVLLFFIIVFLAWTALYTKAKGPIGAMLLSVLFLIFAIKDFRAYFFRNLYVFALCFIVLFGVFKVTNTYLTDYIKPFLPPASYGGEHSFSDRLEYWKTAYDAMTNSNAYIQGLGLSGSSYYLFPVAHVHNVYLSIFFDFGLIGFILFFMVTAGSLTRLFFTIKNMEEGFAKAMLLSTSGCIVLLGVASVTDFSFNLTLLWFLMGIGAAIYRHALSVQKERFA